MSLSNNFPALRPSLLLDFAGSETIDPRITFARASTARFFDQNTVAKAEENLLLRSQEIGTAPWTLLNAAITANSEAAPDGTTTGDLVTAAAGNAAHYVLENFTAVAGQPCAISVFAKAGTHSFIQFAAGADLPVANFNLSTGTVGTTTSVTSATITAVAGGWYRCVVVYTPGLAATSFVISLVSSASAARIEAWAAAGTETVALWGAQVEQRSAVTAYTATTTAPITRYQPQLMTAAANVARLDHDPITREARGLLIEESRSNLLTFTEDWSNAAWTKIQSTIISNSAIAPDGALTADKLVESTVSSLHYTEQAATTTASTACTLSVYAKAAERSWVILQMIGSSVTPSVFVNLSTGAVGTIAGAVSSVQVTSVGNGWYRVALVATTDTTSTRLRVYSTIADGVASYTGDGYSGIFLWGAQLEAGAFATSYIARLDATAASRAADAASMTGTSFTSWYREDEGTLYGEAAPGAITATDYLIAAVNDGTFNNRFVIGSYANAAFMSVESRAVVQANLGSNFNSVTPRVFYKIAAGSALNNFGVSAQGTAPTLDAAGQPAVAPTQLEIGRFGSLRYVNGHIRKIAFYPRRLTDAQLQALTR